MVVNAALVKATQKKPMLQALAGEVTSRVPFWLMRQAGRYLPEYRALRATAGSFLDLCFNPEFAAEVTLQPLRRFDMDAAILFSDILVVPYALGQGLDFVEGEGPQLETFPGVAAFKEIDFESFDKKLAPVYETLRRVRAGLAPEKTLIGFAGAPWTVACYMVQGRGDGEFAAVTKLAFSNPAEFDVLIEALVLATSHYLIQQIRNGADTVQIFDSWAGLVPEPHFSRFVAEPTRKIVQNIHKVFPGFPVIGFPRNAGPLYQTYATKTGVACVGLDQSFSLMNIPQVFNGKVALQGNLDPAILLAGGSVLAAEVGRILEWMKETPFIFNLGHGVIKETPPEHVAQLAGLLKAYQR